MFPMGFAAGSVSTADYMRRKMAYLTNPAVQDAALQGAVRSINPLDTNDSGGVSFAETIRNVPIFSITQLNQYFRIFAALDANADREIDPVELAANRMMTDLNLNRRLELQEVQNNTIQALIDPIGHREAIRDIILISDIGTRFEENNQPQTPQQPQGNQPE